MIRTDSEILINSKSSRVSLSDIIYELKEAYRYRNVVISFVRTSLRQRYRRSILGFGWSLAAPLLHYGIIGFVFGFNAKTGVENYFLYFFSGVIFHGFVAASIQNSTGLMIGNEGFIKKIYLPKLIYVLNGVTLELVNFLFSITALMALGFALGKIDPSVHFLFLPFTIALGLIFMLGAAILVSIGTVFFRDLMHIVPIMMQVVFFSTPILYTVSAVPAQFQRFVKLNPFFYFVEMFRQPIYSHCLPEPKYILRCAIISIVTFVLGLWTLKKFDNKIVFKL